MFQLIRAWTFMETLADRVILLSGLKRWLLTIASGAVLALTVAPFDFPAAGFISFTLLVWLLDGIFAERTGLRSIAAFFRCGFWFAFGFSLASTWWLAAGLFADEMELAWAFPLALLAYPALSALFYGAAAAVAGALWTDGIGRIAALAFTFAIADWLRTETLAGFAFNPIAATGMPTPLLMQGVAVIGMAGVAALAVFVYAAPAVLGNRKQVFSTIGLAAALIAGQTGFGLFTLKGGNPTSNDLSARIVQVEPEKVKIVNNTDYDLNVLLSAFKQSDQTNGYSDLVLWPGLSLPVVLAREPEILEKIASSVNNGQVLVAGTYRTEEGDHPRIYKSTAVVNHNGEVINASDKRILLPLFERPILPEWLQSVADNADMGEVRRYSTGGARQTLPLSENTRALSLMDTEILLPGRFLEYADDADLIIHLSGSMGRSFDFGNYQELRSAQIFAALMRLPVLRASSSGLSAAIDGYGRIRETVSTGATGVIDLLTLPKRAKRTIMMQNRVQEAIFLGFFGIFAFAARLSRRAN
jgi:apolipoprotein N-acyltransferase